MQKLKSLPSAVLAAFLLLSAVCSSCEPQYKDGLNSNIQYTDWACNAKVITVDSCDYIVAQTGTSDGGLSIIHKQNCKYCIARSK